MRRLRPAVSIAALTAVLPACAGSALTRIDVAGSATTVVEPGTLLEQLAGDLGFEDFVSMNLVEAEELRNQGVEPGDITSAQLRSFELEATEPSGADLSFIEALRVAVAAPSLPSATVASAADFPSGDALVAFDVTDVDLAPYIVSASMTLTTDVTARRPDEAVTVEARYVVEVGVTLQGVTGEL